MTDQAFEQANTCAQQCLAKGPVATHAEYDPSRRRLIIALSNGLELGIAPDLVEGLADTSPMALAQIEISPSGLGLHFPELDTDVYIPALLEGILGSPRWMAQRMRDMGKKGGQAKTEAKTKAAQENSKRGGRPRKLAL
ncbi:uncharacterized protein DUF2442 [Azomonas agilis]|uniref:Uncharacterized protein DUF2442 n=1 Tax=Azomonas agilis TaxID=116849 RepID=A0A562IZ68_9GAMM|nr:DUF2442 domain-containing protein [Azomonas agilis]TWH76257.1 uncharacterized protein DUF2442 [Azomonas agilis]